MANQLTIHFNNFNSSLAKGWDHYLTIAIDGEPVRNITKSETIYVGSGEHTVQCMYLHRSYKDSEAEKYFTKTYTFDSTSNDAVFTFNLYYITYEKNNNGFDFGPGIIPERDKKDQKQGGCYVATCVYGSYDCPEVWTLRRFRDFTLLETWYGRLFVKLYYKISPTMVKLFGDYKWFKKIFRNPLNKMVRKLKESGVEDTPYQDKM